MNEIKFEVNILDAMLQLLRNHLYLTFDISMDGSGHSRKIKDIHFQIVNFAIGLYNDCERVFISATSKIPTLCKNVLNCSHVVWK